LNLEVAFTPGELGGAGVGQRTVVVIDVLRATSTILQALVNGARDVLPVESVEQAVRKAQEIGRDQVILCGERDINPIAGFDLGNSPLEFVAERVSGRTLVMTTTNGTRAIVLGAGGTRCMIASFLNAGATAAALAQSESDVLILGAGREGRFSLEDGVCAGMIVRELKRQYSGRVETNDAAKAASFMAARFGKRLAEFLPRTAAGRRLEAMGRRAEIDFCATLDRYAHVPRVLERRITL
jgi:2-phosphosulfolactate phosphatase